jgi:hypothetical protein
MCSKEARICFVIILLITHSGLSSLLSCYGLLHLSILIMQFFGVMRVVHIFT